MDTQQEVAAKYNVTAYVWQTLTMLVMGANLDYRLPTFIIFKQGNVVETVQGADPRKLQDVVKKLAAEADGGSAAGGFGGPSGTSSWRDGELPRGYNDVSDQVDVKGLELLNADSEFGGVRILFDESKPTALLKGKAASEKKDWVESDTDEQLMMFLPFQSMLKVHTLQVSFSCLECYETTNTVLPDHLSSSYFRR